MPSSKRALALPLAALAFSALASGADLDEVQKRGEYFGDEAPEILKRAREEAER